jgi:DNA-binding LacI/PurR family transcriptional regulator
VFTHIKQNEVMMGRQAVQILLEHMNGVTTPQMVTVDFAFVEAKSEAWLHR